MSTTYSFSTFQELIDRVPSNRIECCLKEMAEGMRFAKNMAELACLMQGIQYTPGMIKFPAVTEWIDDGKGQVVVVMEDKSGQSITIKTA